MKLSEVIARIDKSNPWSVDIEDLAKELGIPYYGWSEEADRRLKAYYIQKWLCTDTWVGSMAVFFDDKFIAYSYQSARKNHTNFYFVPEGISVLRDFILKLLIEDEGRQPELVDMDQQFEEFYRLTYANAVLDSKAFLDDGTEVEIVNEGWRGYGADDVLVKFPASGAQKRMNVIDLKFRIGIT